MNSKPITFVSFCVDIGRGLLPQNNSVYRSFELYKTGMYENIETIVPLVLYSSIKDLNIPEHRNDSNFKHFYLDKTLLELEFPNFDLYKKHYPTTCKDEIETSLFHYTPLVVFKMKKMMEIVDNNPFNSDIFFWMDCFFLRGMLETDFLFLEEKYLNVYENVKNKIEDKFVLLNFGSRPLGFFWGGNKESLKKVYQNYFDIFFENLPTKLVTEELIFKIINERYPDLFYNIEIDTSSSYKLYCQNFLIK